MPKPLVRAAAPQHYLCNGLSERRELLCIALAIMGLQPHGKQPLGSLVYFDVKHLLILSDIDSLPSSLPQPEVGCLAGSAPKPKPDS